MIFAFILFPCINICLYYHQAWIAKSTPDQTSSTISSFWKVSEALFRCNLSHATIDLGPIKELFQIETITTYRLFDPLSFFNDLLLEPSRRWSINNLANQRIMYEKRLSPSMRFLKRSGPLLVIMGGLIGSDLKNGLWSFKWLFNKKSIKLNINFWNIEFKSRLDLYRNMMKERKEESDFGDVWKESESIN